MIETLETKSEVGPKLLLPGAVIQGGASVLGFPHRFTRFCIMSNKMFYKIKHGINTLSELTLQFGAAEVMHCAKFSHRRCFLAKQERKLHIKSFLEKRKCCFPLLWSPESGKLQPFQTFGDFGDEKWPAKAMRFGNLGNS